MSVDDRRPHCAAGLRPTVIGHTSSRDTNLETFGEIVTVISSKLTHKGELTKKDTSAKCDYAVITFKHGDGEGRGTVFAKNTRMVQRDVDRDGPTDYRVIVTP